MRIRVANAVGGKPAGVYGGKAEAADFWAGEVKDRSRFDKRGNPAGENPAACRRAFMAEQISGLYFYFKVLSCPA